MEESMTPERFLETLSDAYEAFSTGDRGHSAACLCLMVDHWDRLRDRYGYRELFSLLGKLRRLAESEMDVELVSCSFNERCVLMLLPHSPLKTTEKQAAKLFESVNRETFPVGNESLVLSVSLGFVEFDHRFTSADRLLLSLVKSVEQFSLAGGNRIRHIRPDVSSQQATRNHQQMLGLLMESLRKNDLKVLFQPLMPTAEEVAHSFQILPRLVGADGSLIPAASFIPVAREARVLGVLDRWMIQRAIHLLVDDHHLQPIRFFLSQGDSLLVNSERRDWLRDLVEKHPAVAGKLVLDFTMEDALAHLQGTREFLQLADELGLEVCLSHVNEYSKWELLASDLQVDYLKMSPGFVERLGKDESLEFLFQRVSRNAREQGTRIIMPMVESASVAASLWRVGADYMQGHMIHEESEKLVLID